MTSVSSICKLKNQVNPSEDEKTWVHIKNMLEDMKKSHKIVQTLQVRIQVRTEAKRSEPTVWVGLGMSADSK